MWDSGHGTKDILREAFQPQMPPALRFHGPWSINLRFHGHAGTSATPGSARRAAKMRCAAAASGPRGLWLYLPPAGGDEAQAELEAPATLAVAKGDCLQPARHDAYEAADRRLHEVGVSLGLRDSEQPLVKTGGGFGGGWSMRRRRRLEMGGAGHWTRDTGASRQLVTTCGKMATEI